MEAYLWSVELSRRTGWEVDQPELLKHITPPILKVGVCKGEPYARASFFCAVPVDCSNRFGSIRRCLDNAFDELRIEVLKQCVSRAAKAEKDKEQAECSNI